MADTDTTDIELSETMNELYWSSDMTVDEIVEDLGIGRNTLYAAIRPESAAAGCPDCGERLVFTNRTNRSAGTATCVACDVEVDLSVPESGSELEGAEPAARDDLDGDVGPHDAWTRWREDLAAVSPERVAMIGGAAALGVMAGTLAARALREMR